MIRIGKPYIINNNGKYRLESIIENSRRNTSIKLWYEVSKEYKTYLCDELADAFLLAVLPIAANSEQNIIVEYNTSPRLLHAIKEFHIPFLSSFFGNNPINVEAVECKKVELKKGGAVSTGASLGVDSLSTIFKYIDESTNPEYKLTHLSVFNSCQLGTIDQDKTEENLKLSYKSSSLFAEEIGLPVVVVNSNVSQLLEGEYLSVTRVFPYFTISCALALQSFYNKYIFASSYSSREMRIDKADISHAEASYIPMMSTENMEVVLSDAFMSRTEKTEYISKQELTREYIDVCWANQIANIENGRNDYLDGKKHRNCGWCDKCMRTLLTLEILGVINDYDEAFDLEKYYYHKRDFILKVVSKKNSNNHYKEITELMREYGWKEPALGIVLQKLPLDNKKVVDLWHMYNKTRIKRR